MSRLDGVVSARRLKIAGAAVGVLVVSIVGAFAFGVLGAPAVEEVDNRFGEASNETTVVYTDLVVNNPNPIGVQLGDTTINYTVRMNDVPMAVGGREGLNIEEGNSTQEFTTRMDNEQIPPWWVTHLRNDQVTNLRIEFYAVVSTDQLAQDVRIPLDRLTYEETIETDIFGNKNATADDRPGPTPTPSNGEPAATPTSTPTPTSEDPVESPTDDPLSEPTPTDDDLLP